ncbi:MAG: polysaccharide deacetylase family protein [Candidatus Micrarchaeota archaeon]
MNAFSLVNDRVTVSDMNEGVGTGKWVAVTPAGSSVEEDTNSSRTNDSYGVRLGTTNGALVKASRVKNFTALYGLDSSYNILRFDYYTDQNSESTSGPTIFVANTDISAYWSCSFLTYVVPSLNSYIFDKYQKHVGWINMDTCSKNSPLMSMSSVGQIRIQTASASGNDFNITFDRIQFYKRQFTGAKILLTFDDDYVSEYTAAYPKMAEKGFKGTSFLIMNSAGNSPGDTGKLSIAQIQEMYNAGWDIGTHGATTLTGLSVSDAVADINQNKNLIDGNGWTRASMHYAYPGGVTSTAIKFAIDDFISTAATSLATADYNFPMRDPYYLPRVSVGFPVPLATVEGRVWNCVDQNDVCVFNFHNLKTGADTSMDWSISDFNSFIDFLATLDSNGTNLDVITISQLWDMQLRAQHTITSTINKVDNNPFSGALPVFSSARDGNLTMDFNAIGTYDQNFAVDFNYSANATYATGTSVFKDFNIVSGFFTCDDTNFLDSTHCAFDWNISNVADGNYYALLYFHNVAEGFKASDKNFMIDNTKPSTSWDGNIVWQKTDSNVHLTCVDATSGCLSTWYRLDTDSGSGISWGNWLAFDKNILVTLDGNRAIDFNSTDNAGNIGDTNTFYVLIDKTAPTISISSPANGSTQLGSTVNLSYSGSDENSGIRTYWVSSDGTTWVNNGTNTAYSFTSQTSGLHTYYVIANDNADNNSSTASVSLTVNLPPDVNLTRIDSYLDNQPLPVFSYARDGNLTIDFNVQDDTNNLLVDLNYSLSATQGTGTSIVRDLNLSSLSTSGPYHCQDTNFFDSTQCSIDWNISNIVDANYFLLISITDGNQTDFNSSDNNFMIDNTKPSTSWDGNITWQNHDANAHLTCVDATSGCSSTWYSLDTDSGSGISWGNWQAFDKNILVTSDGNWAIDFNSTDNAGNIGDTNTFYVLVDKTNPSVVADNNYAWQKTDANIHLTCSDAFSGCSTKYFRKDADSNLGVSYGAWTAYDTNIFFGTDGNYALDFNAVDNTGNWDDINTVYILVDKTAPLVSISSPVTGSTSTSSTVTIQYLGSDSNSGIARYWVAVDSNANSAFVNNGTNTNYSFTNQANGTHVYYMKATDNADNNSLDANVTVTVSVSSGNNNNTGGGGYPACFYYSGSDICTADENCSGGWLNAYDSVRCCSVTCTAISNPSGEPGSSEEPILSATKEYSADDSSGELLELPFVQELVRTGNQIALCSGNQFVRSVRVNPIKNAQGQIIGYKAFLDLNVTNSCNQKMKTARVFEEIPKSLLLDAAKIESLTAIEIVKADPIVAFSVGDLEPKESKTISYTFSKETLPTQEQLEQFKKPLLLFELEKVNSCEGKNCGDSNPCTVDYCRDGNCVFAFATNGTACPNGLCERGICQSVFQPQAPSSEPVTGGPVAPIVGIVIVVVLLLAGFFWLREKRKPKFK